MSNKRNVMLAYPYEEKRLDNWPSIFFAQPKLDGIRCQAHFDPLTLDVSLLTSTGDNITSMEHIQRELRTLYHETPIHDGVFDGELYAHNESFNVISGLARRQSYDYTLSKKIKFFIFDYFIPSMDNTFKERLKLLNHIAKFPAFRESKYLEIVETKYVDRFLIEVYLAHQVRNNYEGIILRNPNGYYVPRRTSDLMKLKPRKEDAYKIVGVTEAKDIHGEPKNMLGALVLTDGEQYFKVGSGLTEQQRKDLWLSPPVGKIAVIKYQELSKEYNVPRFPILIDIQPGQ